MQSKLVVRTQELVRASGKPLSEIAREANVPYHALYYVMSGVTKSPNVNHIEALYVHLSGKPLDLS